MKTYVKEKLFSAMWHKIVGVQDPCQYGQERSTREGDFFLLWHARIIYYLGDITERLLADWHKRVT